MKTINISLPEQLHAHANKLVAAGEFASFSDVVRTAIRDLVRNKLHDTWVREAKEEMKAGRGVILSDKKSVDDYFSKL